MKIAVIGAGGVGGYFGGRLSEAGEEVSFVVRGQHLEAIRSRGLKVDSINGDFHVKPVATDKPDELGTADVVIIGVKAWQVPDVAVQIRPLVGKDTLILPLQNGVEAPDLLAKLYGPEAVLGGLCRIITFIVAPGHIAHTGVNPHLVFGDLRGGRCERGEKLLETLQRAKIDAKISEDIQVALWQKFLLISSWSGIGAVSRLTIGAICQNPETRKLLEMAMTEILTIANGKGIAVPADTVEKTIRFFDGVQPTGTASMQRDLLEGRPSELEDQIGAVVRFGKELNVATPVHDFIYACLAPHERVARGKSL